MAVHDFLNKGQATPHDGTIARGLAHVLSGGDTDVLDAVSEIDILSLERDVIVRLTQTPETRARVQHMLKVGKPLRN
jgi:3-hydroxyacyl-CoA dehydrogenase